MSAHSQALTLSLVIPAYNEERYLRKCLQSIAAQTEKPDEVIVVNNNSTDATADIANSFDFVTLVNEPKQGRAFARNTGFALAKSDLIGRIDGDVVLHKNWVATAKQAFIDEQVSAITGPGYTRTISYVYFPKIFKKRTRFWSGVFYYIYAAVARINVLWGANMVIRKDAWSKIAPLTCTDDYLVHEDQDISFLLAGHGLSVRYDPDLVMQKDGLSYIWWPKYVNYVRRGFQTTFYHNKRGTLRSHQSITRSIIFSTSVLIVLIWPWLVFTLASYLHYVPNRLHGRAQSYSPLP